MAEDTENRGLCLTCRNRTTCTIGRKPGETVLFCEHFEVESPPAAEFAAEDLPLFAELRAAEQRASEGFIGLCSDCEARLTCRFPRPEGGVWHCEEYK